MSKCLLYWGAKTGHSIPGLASLVLSRETGSSPSAWQHSSQEAICLHCIGAFLAHVQPGFHQDPQVFFVKDALQLVDPTAWHLGLFLSRGRTWHFPLLSFMRFLPAHFSSLSRSLWMTAQTSGETDSPPSFVSSANLLRVHSVPPCR